MKETEGVSRFRIPRSRGAVSGLLLILLGAWGALIPFIGPYFDFAYEPDSPWVWTAGRGWLEVLPGAVTVAGGLLLLMSKNRANAMLGGWLAVIAGAWFVVGRLFAEPWNLGELGSPVATTTSGLVILELAFFTGLGALIIMLSSLVLGRLSVRSSRDIQYAQREALASANQPAETTTTDNRREVEDDSHHRSGWHGIFGGSHRHRTPVAH